MAKKRKNESMTVETLIHKGASRKYIPTVEYQSVLNDEEMTPIRVAYERRNRDLDPQLVWRGKDEQDWSDLVVPVPPIYIQEKVHPKVLIDDLLRRSKEDKKEDESQPDLFADFNGLPSETARTEFYQHDANWSNRMILGDSLHVMASLAEREGLRGKVQCIYMDPPYGIRFNSNFQWSTTSRDVKDGKPDHITREPEQVKAFRDTWRDGIHSYLTYLRDRLLVARELLHESGSIFVQISDENIHHVRELMDEVFGAGNFVRLITFAKTGSMVANELGRTCDYLIWYGRDKRDLKYRQLYFEKLPDAFYSNVELSDGTVRKITRSEMVDPSLLPSGARIFRLVSSESSGPPSGDTPVKFEGETFRPNKNSHWKLAYPDGMEALKRSGRMVRDGNKLRWKYYIGDYPLKVLSEVWNDTAGFNPDQKYVVETRTKVIERCILMTTDPGDLVLDPTCGSGTTAYVAEQWGRRWITIDTSRVALALARARIMGARYPYYILADSPQGQLKEAEIRGTVPSQAPTRGDIRQGFVYERVPHVTLKSIANNAEIDVIWEKFQEKLEPLRRQLNETLGVDWEEWQIPRESEDSWPLLAKKLHSQWWAHRIARQKEIDASIAKNADFEYLYDKPYEDKKVVRVAGPFTVESLSPHRVLGVDEDDNLIGTATQSYTGQRGEWDFVQTILENLKTSGVQQAHKEDKIVFTSLAPWPGRLVCAEGRYFEGSETSPTEKRAAIFIGPEFGTVSRPDLVEAAREALDARFDVLIACAFNYEAHASDFSKLARLPVLRARMNADLHMAEDLENTGKGNLFVIFGEPEIKILDADNGQIRVKIAGIDVFDPSTGEVRSSGPDEIACWFIDTDYNEESFFVRHAYFLGTSDPYKSLKTTLKAEINEEAWSTLHSDTSRPFDRPRSGRIAVKVINHLGDEVMKVFRV
jgi:adenine-specific DNA-methyltransferase